MLTWDYAVTFNLRHHRAGHLFQNRYKSIVCEEDPYLLELVRYIHLNPLRVGVVDDIDSLDRYPFTGHSVLMGEQLLAGQNIAEILAFFGTTGSARENYRRFVIDGAGQGKRGELCGGGLRPVVKMGIEDEPPWIQKDGPRWRGSGEDARNNPIGSVPAEHGRGKTVPDECEF